MLETDQKPVLEAKNLTIGYYSKTGTSDVASNIDFCLNRGELIALVGANGIGKSTLLRTLTNVQQPLSGEVHINSKNLSSFKPIDLAKQMSLVLTEQIASKNLTVFELIALGRQPYTNWVGNLSDHDTLIIDRALTQTNIQDLKDQRCYELSDGQLQKVMIARALAQDTDLIILDEPTTHLDMYHKAYILKLLRELTLETGKTILYSTHEIDLAIQLSDKMIVMLKNNTVFDTPCNHITRGTFNELFPKDLIGFDPLSGSFKVKK